MRKYLLLFICVVASLYSVAQDFPYAKMLKMTDSELEGAKFKYNSEHNQWVLRKLNGFQVASNILGYASDMRYDKNDYIITIQKGDNSEVAFIDVRFYDDEIFHKIMTFAKDNGRDLLETSSGALNKIQFAYDDFSMVLQYKKNDSSVITMRTTATARTIDDSYNEYHFTVNTGVEPKSEFIIKQAERNAKRDAKGKKQRSAADLM